MASPDNSVNPNLAALMRVIEEHQSKIPEGEYLLAMNALGALHREEEEMRRREAAAAAAGGAAAEAAAVIPLRPYSAASVNLFSQPRLATNQDEVDVADYQAWLRVTRELPDYSQVTLEHWMAISEQDRNHLLHRATESIVSTFERQFRNPDATVCPFISRHSVGSWRFGTDDASWTCVCGYSGKSKHWKKHEESERHQAWAEHRTVSRRVILKMRRQIEEDNTGHLVRFNPTCANRSGVRCFLAHQDENEWTSPEMFPEAIRKARDGTWDVIVKQHWSRHYEI
jgi:hypothetical protein